MNEVSTTRVLPPPVDVELEEAPPDEQALRATSAAAENRDTAAAGCDPIRGLDMGVSRSRAERERAGRGAIGCRGGVDLDECLLG
ncbi:hypothetical protein GCM10009838_11040 [Catenulispora subtropica]|uniref:Uncharacterized protein n=1 Tax=Catenulispora subtropica TaxID=450798 RepID=A0ABN2QRV9_9ACTN